MPESEITIKTKMLSVLKTGEMLYRCGAETRLIVQTSERVAKAIGLDNISVVAVPEFLSLIDNKTGIQLMSNRCSIGCDMSVLSEIFKLCLKLENHEISHEMFDKLLTSIHSHKYNLATLIFMIAVATATFVFLNGGGYLAIFAGFIVGGCAMSYRLLCQHMKFFPIFIFATTGFVATLLSYILGIYLLNANPKDTHILMAVSVLLLVPGFPFINGILDLVKGYSSMAVNRLIQTTILLVSVAAGIYFALLLISGFFV